MKHHITICPVTRIEGHAKVTILIEENEVKNALFQVLEFRAFEHFIKNRPIEELPILVTRICGLCSTAHHLASIKAVDHIFGLEIPDEARNLRLMLHLAGIIHSHLLHFFILYLPDLMLSDVPLQKRGFTELLRRYPSLIKQALKVRIFAHKVLEALAGSSIHPTGAVPGSFSKPLEHEVRMELLSLCNEAQRTYSQILNSIRPHIERFLSQSELNIPSNYLALYDETDLALYDSPTIKAISSNGNVIDSFDPCNYLEHINELVVEWSYAKAPFLTKLGYPDGFYRVGPLARINIAEKIDSDWAESLKVEYGFRSGIVINSTRHYNLARLIEIAYCLDKICELLKDPSIERESILRSVPRKLKIVSNEGIGIVEAPRGTLIHHYRVNDEGLVTHANMIVATVQNTPIISRDIRILVTKIIEREGVNEEKIWREVTALVRDYDPCLSCSVHSIGSPLTIEIVLSNTNSIVRLPKDLK